MKRILFLAFCFSLLLVLASCQHTAVVKLPDPVVNTHIDIPKGNCEMENNQENLKRSSKKGDTYVLQMPAIGEMITESHYITQEDGIKIGTIKKGSSTVSNHLDKSCKLLQEKFGVSNCSEVYRASYTKLWNGDDGAGENIGVGGRYYAHPAFDSLPPDIQTEMFQANMYWSLADLPYYPTKYLIIYGNNSVVVNMGYEQGPPLKDGLVGVQPEIAYFLQAPNESTVVVGKLKDQSLPYGPIICN